jgi:hypothetical protein
LDEQAPKKFIQWCNDGDWIFENYQVLLPNYENKYIAVRNNQVLDNDKNHLRLIQRLQRKYGRDDTYNIQIKLIRKYENFSLT